MIVNQWVPAAHRGDAIGDSARRVRDLLRSLGHPSEIYALTIDDDMRSEVKPFSSADSSTGDVTIFHYAVPSPMTQAFARLPRGRVLQYHNITPPHFLADQTDLALGDSEYNRSELEALGFRRTGVFPIALNVERLAAAPPNPVLDRMLSDGLSNFLFVGRIVPNKRVEDIIRLAEVYKRYIDTHYRFIFVGRTEGIPRYHATVRALIKEFDMLPERFLFPGAVTDWELAAYYRSASAYLSLSEHEGFCVPVLEAMAAGVPVFAYESTAVGETLGGAGVCWSPKDLEFAAELLGQVAFDPALRTRIIAAQYERLEQFSEARLVERLKRELSRL
jgi:glycosyltransferase involved in cell wall biosynthesis